MPEAGLAFGQRRVACLQFVRHFLQCLPQVVEIATALQAWQVGEIACANAFHACTQRGHGPQNAPVRQGQQAQRTKQHGHRQHHCLCTELVPGFCGHRAQVIVNPQHALARGAHFARLQAHGDRGHCRQSQLRTVQRQELTLRPANLPHGVFGVAG